MDGLARIAYVNPKKFGGLRALETSILMQYASKARMVLID